MNMTFSCTFGEDLRSQIREHLKLVGLEVSVKKDKKPKSKRTTNPLVNVSGYDNKSVMPVFRFNYNNKIVLKNMNIQKTDVSKVPLKK